MARAKNIQARETIKLAAYHLLMEKGYNKTTYSEIASACGCERTSIQYYFPNKKLIIQEFLFRLLSLSEEYVNDKYTKHENDFINLYLISQVYFAFFLYDDEFNQLTLDFLSSRLISEAVIDFNLDWILSSYMKNWQGPEKNMKKEDIEEIIVLTMGGVYELIYRNLRNGNRNNIPRLMKKALESFMVGMDVPDKESLDVSEGNALSDKDLYEAKCYLIKAVLLPEKEDLF